MGVRIDDARELATTLAGELRKRGRDAYGPVSYTHLTLPTTERV